MKCEVCGDEEATTIIEDSICGGIMWEVCQTCAKMFAEMFDEFDGYVGSIQEKMADIDDSYFE